MNKSKKDNDNIDRNNSKSENNKNKRDMTMLMKKFHQNIRLKMIRFKRSKDHYLSSL